MQSYNVSDNPVRQHYMTQVIENTAILTDNSDHNKSKHLFINILPSDKNDHHDDDNSHAHHHGNNGAGYDGHRLFTLLTFTGQGFVLC